MDSRIVAGLGVLLAGGGFALWYFLKSPQSDTTDDGTPVEDGADDTVGDVEASVTASLSGWQTVGSAAQWLPVLNAAESAHNLPPNILARMAYQESHFREDIIRGTKKSGAGALGILQLLPQYFNSVNAAIPYSDDSVSAQIDEAATLVQSLYHQFGNWQLALAAYNAGPGNVRKYGGIPPFTETQNYVAQITADVPALSA